MAEARADLAPVEDPPPSVTEAPRQRRRAERRRARVIAKLLLEDERDEAVLLADISETGVRLRIPRDVPLTIEEALAATLVVRVESRESPMMLRLDVALVRVAEVTPKQIDLAFQFRSIAPGDAEALAHLRNLIFL